MAFNIISIDSDDTVYPGQLAVISCSGNIGVSTGSVKLQDANSVVSITQPVQSWNSGSNQITVLVQAGSLRYGRTDHILKVTSAAAEVETMGGVTLEPEASVEYQDMLNPTNGPNTAGSLLGVSLTTNSQVAWKDVNNLNINISSNGNVTGAPGSFHLKAWDPVTHTWTQYQYVTFGSAPINLTEVGPIEGFPTVYPDTMDWEVVDGIQAFRSDLNGIESSAEFPGAKWKIKMVFGKRSGEEGRALSAFLIGLRGQSRRFNVTPVSFAPLNGTAEGSPTVDGANQTGGVLRTKGWLADQAMALAVGDFFGVNGELKMVTSPVATDASGDAVIEFAPNLHQAPPANAEIQLTQPKVRCKLTSKGGWSLSSPVLYGITVECTEALDG